MFCLDSRNDEFEGGILGLVNMLLLEIFGYFHPA